MMRRIEPTFLVFGALGGLLLFTLVLPIVNLFIQADLTGWTRSLQEPGASDALGVSALSSAISVVIMTLFGVPLGYVLARGRLRFTQFWIALVFLPMVVPDLADFLEEMGDVDDGKTLGAKRANDREELLHVVGREAAGGLVENEHPAAGLRYRAGDLDELLTRG